MFIVLKGIATITHSLMPEKSARAVIATLAGVTEGGILTLEAAARALRTDRRATTRRLAALIKGGWLSRIRRGVFAIRPLEAAPGLEIAEEDPWTVAARVFAPCYIGGWSAAEHWNLTEQLFRSTFVVTARPVRRSDVVVGSSAFRLARQSHATTGGFARVWRGNARISVSGIERTIVDACVNPSWVGGGRHLVDIFRAAVADERIAAAKLLHAMHAGMSGAAHGRICLLVETYWPDAVNVADFARVRRGTGVVRFDPSVRGRGRLVRRWGLWVNVTLPEANT